MNLPQHRVRHIRRVRRPRSGRFAAFVLFFFFFFFDKGVELEAVDKFVPECVVKVNEFKKGPLFKIALAHHGRCQPHDLVPVLEREVERDHVARSEADLLQGGRRGHAAAAELAVVGSGEPKSPHYPDVPAAQVRQVRHRADDDPEEVGPPALSRPAQVAGAEAALHVRLPGEAKGVQLLGRVGRLVEQHVHEPGVELAEQRVGRAPLQPQRRDGEPLPQQAAQAAVERGVQAPPQQGPDRPEGPASGSGGSSSPGDVLVQIKWVVPQARVRPGPAIAERARIVLVHNVTLDITPGVKHVAATPVQHDNVLALGNHGQ